MFYKSVKIKNCSVSIEKFSKKAKVISSVYNNGFHYWKDSMNSIQFFSLVFLNFRFTISRTCKQNSCSN